MELYTKKKTDFIICPERVDEELTFAKIHDVIFSDSLSFFVQVFNCRIL